MVTAAMDADSVVLVVAFPPCSPGVTGRIGNRIHVVSRGWAASLVNPITGTNVQHFGQAGPWRGW
jgi:hypothetical protein